MLFGEDAGCFYFCCLEFLLRVVLDTTSKTRLVYFLFT